MANITSTRKVDYCPIEGDCESPTQDPVTWGAENRFLVHADGELRIREDFITSTFEDDMPAFYPDPIGRAPSYQTVTLADGTRVDRKLNHAGRCIKERFAR